jgi:hypothetical protein
MKEECKSILCNNTFTTIHFRKAMPLRIKPIGSKWVNKPTHNPASTIRYTARLVIEGNDQIDFGETHAPVRKLTTCWYLISPVGKQGCNINHLDVVTAFLNPEVDDDDICMTLSKGWAEALITPTIIV